MGTGFIGSNDPNYVDQYQGDTHGTGGMSAAGRQQMYANNGMQGTGHPQIAGVTNSGYRAGSSDDDPSINFYTGAATPGYMQTQLAPAAQAQYVNGLNQNALGAQNSLLAQLQAQAMGKGPSLAQMQLQQGTDANLRAQAALAAGGRNPAMASYQAGQNQAAAGQQLAGQSAMARLQEQYQAQQGLMGLAGQMQSNSLANAGMMQDVNLANMGALNQFGLTQGQMNQNANQFYNNMMAGQQNSYNQYLQQKDLTRTQDNDQFRQSIIQGLIGGGAQMGSSAMGMGAGGAGGGAGVAAAASDERNKIHVADGRALLHELLSKAGTHAYDYKHPGAPGQDSRTHVSPMAQEIEKSKLGAQMVKDTPSGKMVDYGPHTVGTLMAALADMHKRVEALESKKRKAA